MYSLIDIKLIEAIKTQTSEIVAHCLDNGADPNCLSVEGRHVIFYALANDDMESFKLLINHSHIDLSVVERNGDTILHLLAKYAKNKLIIKVLGKGININPRNNNRLTPLFYAVHHSKSFSSIRLLLEHGAIVDNITIRRFFSLLIKDNDLDLVKLFIERYLVTNPEPDIDRLIKWAVKLDNWVIFNYLNTQYPDRVKSMAKLKFKHEYTLLHHTRKVKIAKQLILYGADVNAADENDSPPIGCLYDQNLKLAQLYLDYGVDLSVKGESIITEMKYYGQHVISNLLSEHMQALPEIKEPDDE